MSENDRHGYPTGRLSDIEHLQGLLDTERKNKMLHIEARKKAEAVIDRVKAECRDWEASIPAQNSLEEEVEGETISRVIAGIRKALDGTKAGEPATASVRPSAPIEAKGGDRCPECGYNTLVQPVGGGVRCENKHCGYWYCD